MAGPTPDSVFLRRAYCTGVTLSEIPYYYSILFSLFWNLSLLVRLLLILSLSAMNAGCLTRSPGWQGKEGPRPTVQKEALDETPPVSQDKRPVIQDENLLDTKLSWPIQGNVIKEFGNGDEVHRNGITIEGHEGANVRSAGSGKVGHVGDIPGLGKVVLIDHSDRLVSVYAQLNETLVSAGDSVTRNQVIGSLGGAGQPGKPTLYFEVRSHAKATNPVKFLKTKHQ